MVKTIVDIRKRHIGAALGLRPARGQHSAAESEALVRHAAGRRSVVEIGVAEGVSAAAIRSVMDQTGTLRLIDPYRGHFGIISPAYLVARRTVSRVSGPKDVRWIRRSSMK